MNTFHLPVAAVAFGFLARLRRLYFYRVMFISTKQLLLYSVQISYYIFRKYES
jgi:hypothetical protein